MNKWFKKLFGHREEKTEQPSTKITFVNGGTIETFQTNVESPKICGQGDAMIAIANPVCFWCDGTGENDEFMPLVPISLTTCTFCAGTGKAPGRLDV